MSEWLIVICYFVGLFIGCGVGVVIGYRSGRKDIIDAHNRNQEIAREAAKDPQVQAALDER